MPVAHGHYELYTAAIGTHVKGDTSGGLASVELTYGLIPNGQLQIGGELAFDSSEEGTHFGYGDTQLSFKYRFIQEQTNAFMPQVAVFPAIFFPTGDERRGLGAGHISVFLPVWAQKSFGDWSTSLSDKPVSSAMSASGRPSAKPSRTVVLSHAQ